MQRIMILGYRKLKYLEISQYCITENNVLKEIHNGFSFTVLESIVAA